MLLQRKVERPVTSSQPPTPAADLSKIDPQVEIIVRAGNVSVPQARSTLQTNYRVQDANHPDVIGLSVVFHPGDTYVGLAQRNSFRHQKLSFNTVGAIQQALGRAGFGLILYVTPDLPLLPDHHILAVTVNSLAQLELSDAAVDALIAVLMVVDNPYQRPDARRVSVQKRGPPCVK